MPVRQVRKAALWMVLGPVTGASVAQLYHNYFRLPLELPSSDEPYPGLDICTAPLPRVHTLRPCPCVAVFGDVASGVLRFNQALL